MNDTPEHHKETDNRTFIGGRHGSPHVIVAFPFSKIQAPDDQTASDVEDLAAIVAALAGHVKALAERPDRDEATTIAAEVQLLGAAAADLTRASGDGDPG